MCEILDYEQPAPYIVESAEYCNDFTIPVLTAGKSFIIGYTDETYGICTDLPVIIFDDFTTDSKFVEFRFKVKSSAMKILRTNRANLKFLFFYMRTIECDHTTHKRYWISNYSQKLIALPPLAEQNRIVTAIESYFTIIDEIENNKTSLQTAIATAKSKILSLAIRGKLVPQNPNDEPASVLLERIRSERETLSRTGKIKRGKGNSVIVQCGDSSYYGKLPTKWALVQLDDVANIVMGQSPSGDLVTDNPDGVEFHQGKIYFTDRYLACSEQYTAEVNKIAKKDSVLLCVRAPVGIVNITKREISIGRGLCALSPLGGISVEFIFHWLTAFQNSFVAQATGSTFMAITTDVVRQQIVPFPPLAEQKRIVSTIEKLFYQLDKVAEGLN